jgi:hypothetical protein
MEYRLGLSEGKKPGERREKSHFRKGRLERKIPRQVSITS